MKKLPFLFIFGFYTTFCFSQTPAQQASGGGNDGLIGTNQRYNSIMPKGEISYDEALGEYKNINGSPFLHGGEITVDLILNNDSIVKSINILYDLYNHELITKINYEKVIILDQLYYTGFIYDNKGKEETYLRLLASEFKFTYNLVLFQNEDFIFCKSNRINLIEDARHVPGKDSKDKRFVSQTKYYISKGKEVNEVHLKKEELINHLPNKYKGKVNSLKRKLGIKKLKKEKDYLLLMQEF